MIFTHGYSIAYFYHTYSLKFSVQRNLDQEQAAVKKKHSSSPRNTFISDTLFLKDGFPRIKMKGKLVCLILPVSSLGKFY